MNSLNTPLSAGESPLAPQPVAAAAITETRPMYWSVRRELWENRSIYIAPLAAAAVYLVGYTISLKGLPRHMRELPALDLLHQQIALAMPYSHAAMLVMATTFVVGIFYSLDALHGERRERSILFWKSLPISDRTIVLSKASIPYVVLPTLTFVITIVLQWIMLFLSSATLLLSGVGAAKLWAKLPLFQLELVLLYVLIAVTLWHAPIYAWLIFVSGWARRATFLWAVLPPAAIGVFELIAFHTSYIGSLLRDRFFGFVGLAFDMRMPDGSPLDAHFIPLTQLTPARLLSSPGLWLGLIVAAGFLAAAVRLRRYREPL